MITAGTFYKDGERVFWDVHHPEQALVVSLAGEQYARLIVEVDDPRRRRQTSTVQSRQSRPGRRDRVQRGVTESHDAGLAGWQIGARGATTLPAAKPLPIYPLQLEADVALGDGSIAHVRPIRAQDEPGLLAFLRSLPDEDRRMRFFSLSTNLAGIAHKQADIDYTTSLGLLVTVGPDKRIIGHALYAASADNRAEVAFAVASEYQGRGLSSVLLGQLSQAAATHGIETFEAVVLPENRHMLDVFRHSGYPVETRYAGDSVEVSFPTSLGLAALARFAQREELASASALRRVLYPRSVAVIGASRKPDAVGAAVVHNLLATSFPGPIYPVNPVAKVIQSLEAYPSVEAIPAAVGLAVVAVPSTHVLQAAEECGRSGVHALVVLTAGFGESGPAGQLLQAQLLQMCRTYGMRLIGPNCIGVINTDPSSPLNATFGPLMPAAGPFGLATQSGALGLAAIDFMSARGLGFSSVISMGNKADISGNDLLGYWHTDARTDVILLYLESFGNPRKFARIAREVGRTKPIVALKSGRSAVGARATASHTGALLAASDVTVDALFRQAGVIRTDTLEELLDVADLLAHQPLPSGRGVAIVTNVGGPAVMCADACEAHRLHVPSLSEATQTRLREILPPEASLSNPVDMLAAASAEQYRQTVRIVAGDAGVDAVIAIFLPPLATRADDVAAALVAATDTPAGGKPLLSVFMSAARPPELLRASTSHRIPAYQMPEPAAIALAHAVEYAAWRARPTEPPVYLANVMRDEAGLLLADAVARGGGWLAVDEVRRLLSLYGVPIVEQRVAATPGEAETAATELGGELALKVIAPGVLHKSDVGGVRLHLGEQTIRAAAESMAAQVREATGQDATGFLVQRMAPAGVEMLVGVVNDPQFGPTIACGAGGTLVELLKDVSVRLSPLTRGDAASMLRDLRSFPLLNGYRGAPPRAVGALEDVLVRIGALADDHPHIAEMDCNPVIVTETGAVVVDARVRCEEAALQRPLGARR